jgi:hypothetical protein
VVTRRLPTSPAACVSANLHRPAKRSKYYLAIAKYADKNPSKNPSKKPSKKPTKLVVFFSPNWSEEPTQIRYFFLKKS